MVPDQYENKSDVDKGDGDVVERALSKGGEKAKNCGAYLKKRDKTQQRHGNAPAEAPVPPKSEDHRYHIRDDVEKSEQNDFPDRERLRDHVIHIGIIAYAAGICQLIKEIFLQTVFAGEYTKITDLMIIYKTSCNSYGSQIRSAEKGAEK